MKELGVHITYPNQRIYLKDPPRYKVKLRNFKEDDNPFSELPYNRRVIESLII
jgi:hypothetical protein